ncbi:MAG: hypothetical protein KC620_09035 [Myxococcales bacterium]|nr:hypothetical protein [Myxococcales bacterium]
MRPQAVCPRCQGTVSATAALCPHCNLYLLDWDARRGALGPAPASKPAARPRIRLGLAGWLRVARLLVGSGMVVHGLLVLLQLVEGTATLLAWVVLWLPLDALCRASRGDR